MGNGEIFINKAITHSFKIGIRDNMLQLSPIYNGYLTFSYNWFGR